MRAIVSRAYGELALDEIDRPELGPEHVLVRVRAAGVNPLDYHELHGTPRFARPMLGMRRPKHARRGVDVAGVVEAVGSEVTGFQPGGEVFGIGRGAFGEYVRATEAMLAPKPSRLSFEEAASIPVAAVTALQALRDRGRLQAGQSVLINGASGGVGTFAVQLAKNLGAEVTGVCSTRNLELVRSLGAEHVVDYTRDDFTRTGRPHDLVVNCAEGRSLSDLRRAAAPEGTIVLVTGSIGQILGSLATRRFRKQRVTSFIADVTADDLRFLAGQVEEGKLTPVIDRTYPLEETSEAIRYVEGRHARGKVVVAVS
jgi:NADPH:quinone reductase-like Zn-dependent oxidoreductase